MKSMNIFYKFLLDKTVENNSNSLKNVMKWAKQHRKTEITNYLNS